MEKVFFQLQQQQQQQQQQQHQQQQQQQQQLHHHQGWASDSRTQHLVIAAITTQAWLLSPQKGGTRGTTAFAFFLKRTKRFTAPHYLLHPPHFPSSSLDPRKLHAPDCRDSLSVVRPTREEAPILTYYFIFFSRTGKKCTLLILRWLCWRFVQKSLIQSTPFNLILTFLLPRASLEHNQMHSLS